MINNWFKDMEKITICLGFAIIYLGLNNFLGNSTISPALVAGISLSGLCLTLADFLSKQVKDIKNKRVLSFLYFLDALLYLLAAICIVGYPNSTFMKSLDKEKLDWMSTSASVIALGVVFVAIGISNRKAAIEEDAKQAEELKKLLDETKKVLESTKEIAKSRGELHAKSQEVQEEMSKLIEAKNKQIELLEREIKELKREEKTPSI